MKKIKVFREGEGYLVSTSSELDRARRYTAKGLTSYLINEAVRVHIDFNALNTRDRSQFSGAYAKGLKIGIKKRLGL